MQAKDVKFANMPTVASPRSALTRAAVLDAAMHEFSAFGLRRSSMEGVAKRAGVSRQTLYAHWGSKDALFRSLVEIVHGEQQAAMREAIEAEAPSFEARVLAVLEARFVRFVELTSVSPHAAELYDLHGRLCGDVARASQEDAERLLTRMVRAAAKRGEIDLTRAGLSAARVACVLFDCAHGAKGEDPSTATPAEFQQRLAQVVRVLVTGLEARG